MEKKMTKVQKYAEVIKAIKGETSNMSTAYMVAFLEKEVALLNGKAERKASKKSTENDAYRLAIIECLTSMSEPVTVTTLLGASGLAVSSQKMTAVLGNMVENGEVVNTKTKKGSLYSLASRENCAKSEDEKTED